MIRSMTGYGKAEVQTASGRVIVEIRSVNHRYCEIFAKLPRQFFQYESEMKKLVSQRLKRGKIELFVQWDESAVGGAGPVANVALANQYYAAFNNIKDSLGLDEEVSLALIAGQKDVISVSETVGTQTVAQDELFSAVSSAADNLDYMRLREGETLLEDLLKRRQILAVIIERLAGRAPQVVADFAVRIKERVSQLAGDGAVSEDRLAQEIAIMADRCDITEELVRFRSHLLQFDESLRLDEPIGRKMDFLLQELNREVNTIGSKANDAEIASYVVGLKAELEKIREQMQNVE